MITTPTVMLIISSMASKEGPVEKSGAPASSSQIDADREVNASR